MSFYRRMGRIIRARREQLGMSQNGLARTARISQQMVSIIETGKHGTDVWTLCGICVSLRLPLSAATGVSIEEEM